MSTFERLQNSPARHVLPYQYRGSSPTKHGKPQLSSPTKNKTSQGSSPATPRVPQPQMPQVARLRTKHNLLATDRQLAKEKRDIMDALERRFGSPELLLLEQFVEALRGFFQHVDEEDRPRAHPLALNLGLAMLEQSHILPGLSLPAGEPVADKVFLGQVAWYAKVARAARSSTPSEIASRINLHPSGVHYHVSSKGIDTAGFFLAQDHVRGGSNDLVLALHVASTVHEALGHVIGESAPHLNGLAHQGMLDKAKAVMDLVRPVLRARMTLDSHLTITGFGLGGGTATLLHTIFINELFNDTSLLLSQSRLACFAYGPPPVFSSPTAERDGQNTLPANFSEQLYIIVNRFDFLPRYSANSALMAIRRLKGIDRLNLTTKERLSMIRENDAFRAPQAGGVDRVRVMISLYHIGKVIVLREAEDKEFRFEWMPPSVLNRLVLDSNMFLDGDSQTYVRVTAAVAYKHIEEHTFCVLLERWVPCFADL